MEGDTSCVGAALTPRMGGCACSVYKGVHTCGGLVVTQIVVVCGPGRDIPDYVL